MFPFIRVQVLGFPVSTGPAIHHEQRLPRPDAVHHRQPYRHEGNDDERERRCRDGEGDAEDDAGQDDLRDCVAVDAAARHTRRQRRQVRGRGEEVGDAAEDGVDGEGLVAHEEEEAGEDGGLREAEEALEGRGDEDEDERRLYKVGVALFVCSGYESGVSVVLAR